MAFMAIFMMGVAFLMAVAFIAATMGEAGKKGFRQARATKACENGAKQRQEYNCVIHAP
jgi:hypothetical protein